MSVTGFRVRVAGAEDVAGVVALERSIVEAPHWVETEYAAMVNAGGNLDGVVRRCLFVAEGEGLLGFSVGKLVGSGVDRVAELESVAVTAAARRGGVGRALCRGVIDWCRAQRATVLDLEVRVGSGGAIALYEGLGFVVVGRRKGYYKDPAEDAVMMRLELEKVT